MKTAICLYGTSGYNYSLANNLENRKPLDVKEPLTSLIEKIVLLNNSDIFIHSWSKDREDEITQILQPKKRYFKTL